MTADARLARARPNTKSAASAHRTAFGGCAPVFAPATLPEGSTHSATGGVRSVADSLITTNAAGATGLQAFRADDARFS